jgi:cephalosporin hydroxylase
MGNLSEAEIQHYRHIHTFGNGIREPRWRGTRVVKFPQDMILYAQVIWKRQPDFIIETGTHFGGSALFLADVLSLAGGAKVFSIDVSHAARPPKHPMVEHILGSSTDPEIVERIRREVAGAKVMATLDSDHSTKHVLAELRAYADIVTPGQYMVVEDCWTRHPKPYQPWYAVEEFLKADTRYRRFNLEKQFIFAVTKDGWLRRRR